MIESPIIMRKVQNMDISKMDLDKIKAVVLYIISKTGRIDFHKLFKILYFAEKEHLVIYGRKIVNDEYHAMKDGPVPSFIYDVFKKNSNKLTVAELSYFSSLSVESYFVDSVELPDMDELSETDIACIDKSIRENLTLSKKELTDKSHQFAWKSASSRSCSCANIMYSTDIAIEGGVNEQMLEYIKEKSFIRNCL